MFIGQQCLSTSHPPRFCFSKFCGKRNCIWLMLPETDLKLEYGVAVTIVTQGLSA